MHLQNFHVVVECVEATPASATLSYGGPRLTSHPKSPATRNRVPFQTIRPFYFPMPLIDPVTMSGSKSPSQAVLSKPTNPISLLPTDVARILTHVQPVLLLSTYYLRFSALVADPVSTLTTSLAPLILLQTTYCLFCLPIAPASPIPGKKTPSKKGKPATGKKSYEPSSSINASTIAVRILLFPLLQTSLHTKSDEALTASFSTTARPPLPHPRHPLHPSPRNPPSPPRSACHNPYPRNHPLKRPPQSPGTISTLLHTRSRQNRLV